MKILVLSRSYPTRSVRTGCIFVHRQVRALVELGAQCTVIQPAPWAPPAPFHRLRRDWSGFRADRADMFEELDGIPLVHPPVLLPLPRRWFREDWWHRVGRTVGAYVARAADLRDAAVVYAPFLCEDAYAALVARDATGIPVVGIARGDDLSLQLERWPDRMGKLESVLAGADGLLANCDALARRAEGLARRGLATPVRTIYNGVDTDAFRPALPGERGRARTDLGLDPSATWVLCVGSPIRRKGWDVLLDAMVRGAAAGQPWRLLMVGTGYGSADFDLPGTVRRLGLAERIREFPLVDPAALPPYYRAADAFALPSESEGVSNALLEAMASGLPVITTPVGGHREFVSDGDTGRLVPVGDPVALDRAIRDVLSDPAGAATLGERARRRVEALGSFRRNAEGLLSYLEGVAAAAGRRGRGN